MRIIQTVSVGTLFYLLTAGGLLLSSQTASPVNRRPGQQTGAAVLQTMAKQEAVPPAVHPEQATQSAQQQPAGAVTETQSLHILVGRSVIINMQARLRRVLVSNPAVVETVTTDPTQVVVTAKSAGSSSLILWDEGGQSRIVEVYADVDISGLRDAIQQAYPSEQVQVDPEQGRVILSGTVSSKSVADDLVKMASAFSTQVVNSMVIQEVHRKQILLKVRFAEVNRAKLEAYGINILSTGAANTPGTISTQQFGPPLLGDGSGGQGKITGTIPGGLQGTTTSLSVSDLLNVFLFRPDLNLGATIKALQQRNVLQILAEPNLLAMNGETAQFLAGGEFPFPVVQGGSNFTAVTIQFRPFGVRLEFNGTITDSGVIRLKVTPEVSALDFSNALTISGFVVPAISTRRADTVVELRDGQSFGIAGLMDNRTTALMNKIPGIGDIPVLGNLFRSKQIQRTNTELLVVVTPTIVDPVSQPLTPVAIPKAPLSNLDTGAFDKSVRGSGTSSKQQ